MNEEIALRTPGKPSLSAAGHLDRLAAMQIEDRRRMNRAGRTAWVSVGLAAVLLGLLVMFTVWRVGQARADLAQVRTDVAAMNAERTALDAKLQATRQEVASLQAQKAALTQTFNRVPEGQRRSAVEQQLQADPAAATLLPRVYLQIVDAQDRAWADDVRKRLAGVGIIVPGIELVTRAAALRHNDVRYYKKAERPGAERIAALLQAEGIAADLVYLGRENDPNVRPNHFEVWFVAGSRSTELRKR